jgi:UDP:flavonoid glycosyltransferase YjiC (YdhE family)
MARVLLAWEFGGDLGHVRRLLPIAGQLRAQGHDTALALGDLSSLGTHAAAMEIFQAPLLRPPSAPDAAPLSASDILLSLGYHDASSIAGALRAWFAMFAIWSPDVVVADYAPTALLAARACGLARVALGSGFGMPLAGDPLAALRDWVDTDTAQLAAIDARLLGAITQAFERLRVNQGVPRVAHEVFAADAQLLCTFPEMDPFGPRPGITYVGPVARGAADEEVAWRGEAGPRIFAYLKPRDPRFAGFLAALGSVAREAIVAAPGLAPQEAAALSQGSLRVFANTLNLERVLAAADLCACHASPGVCAAALVAGVPLALLPMQLEQYLIARRLARAGVAELIAPDDATVDFAAWLRAVIARKDLRAVARTHAEGHRGHSFEGAAAEAARRIAGVTSR